MDNTVGNAVVGEEEEGRAVNGTGKGPTKGLQKFVGRLVRDNRSEQPSPEAVPTLLPSLLPLLQALILLLLPLQTEFSLPLLLLLPPPTPNPFPATPAHSCYHTVRMRNNSNHIILPAGASALSCAFLFYCILSYFFSFLFFLLIFHYYYCILSHSHSALFHLFYFHPCVALEPDARRTPRDWFDRAGTVQIV